MAHLLTDIAKRVDAEMRFREEARTNFHRFMAYRFHAERRPFKDNWHLGLFGEIAQLQYARDPDWLSVIINVPPGHLKSECYSQSWQAWMIGQEDSENASLLSAANGKRLAARDSRATMSILDSRWYRALFPRFGRDQETGDQIPWAKRDSMDWVTPGGAVRQAVGRGFRTTGLGTRRLLVDDLVAAREADSEVIREEANIWFREEFSNRQRDMAAGTMTIIMQRLHELDLTGMIEKEMQIAGSQQFRVVCIREEEAKRKVYSIGKFFYARKPQELLFPDLVPAKAVQALKIRMRVGYEGQYNQRPQKLEGGSLKPKWIHRSDQSPQRLISDLGLKPNLYIDLATREKETQKDDPDFNVLVLWARDALGRFWKLHQWRAQANMSTTAQALITICEHWPVHRIVGEKIGIGHAFKNVYEELCLRSERNPRHIYQMSVGQAKEIRAESLVGVVSAGMLWVPGSEPWVEDMMAEYRQWPRGAHDDIIDADAMACLDLPKMHAGDPPPPKSEVPPGAVTGKQLLDMVKHRRRQASQGNDSF